MNKEDRMSIATSLQLAGILLCIGGILNIFGIIIGTLLIFIGLLMGTDEKKKK